MHDVKRSVRRELTSGRPRVTFAILVCGVCSYTLLQSMTVPALPLIQAELGTDQAAAAWVLTAFLISASVATPILGRLGDSQGKKRVLAISLGLLAAGALLSILATNIEVMILARVVQGIAGGVLPLSFGIIRDEFPPERVAGCIALLASLMSVGFGAGIVLSGVIVRLLGYHFLFALPMLMAAAAAVGTLLLVPESPVRSGSPVRLLPATALAAWLVLLLVSVSEAPAQGWASPQTIGGLVLALLVFVLWVRIETTADAPLIDVRLMMSRGIAPANLVALLIGMAMYGSFGFLPQLTQTPPSAGYGFGSSVAEAGYLMLPTAVLSFVGGVASTRIGRVIGDRALIALGCWLNAVGLVMVAFAHTEKWEILVAGSLMGLGSGACFAALANVVVASAPLGLTGVATGVNANLRTIGGAVGSAALATLISSRLTSGGYALEQSYTVGFAGLGVAAAAAGLAALLVQKPSNGPLALPLRESKKSAARAAPSTLPLIGPAADHCDVGSCGYPGK